MQERLENYLFPISHNKFTFNTIFKNDLSSTINVCVELFCSLHHMFNQKRILKFQGFFNPFDYFDRKTMKNIQTRPMSRSCHLDRASNVEIGVECQIFVIVIIFNCGQVLQFKAHPRYYKGALTQKIFFFSDLYYFQIRVC